MSFVFVTVNYKTPQLTIEALRSLSAQVPLVAGARAVVIDNNSQDGSVEQIGQAIEREGWSAWATVKGMPLNGGFSYGNNAAVRLLSDQGADYQAIILLNPDAQLKPGSMATLTRFLADHPKAGIVGTSIQNGDGGPEPSAHNFPNPLGELESAAQFSPLSKALAKFVLTPPFPTSNFSCDWVSGACMVIRKEVLDTVGLFDEGYFLYFEEIDLCRRTKSAGWEIWYVPEAGIVHLEGASTGITQKRKRRAAYWYDSRRRFFTKHYGILGLLATDFLWFLGRVTLLLRRLVRLGGGYGIGTEPLHWMGDLIGGDLKALVTGKLRRKHLETRF